MTSFVDDWTYQELLTISKQHLDSLDKSRVFADGIAGPDNHGALMVSSIFAALAIEAAVNDFILHYCLFIENPRIQEAVGEMAKQYLNRYIGEKLKFVRDRWSEPFPQPLIADVDKLFKIRNQITHQTNKFIPATEAENGKAKITNKPIEDSQHMLRHHDIAHDFLSRFWLPGSREVDWPPSTEKT